MMKTNFIICEIYKDNMYKYFNWKR